MGYPAALKEKGKVEKDEDSYVGEEKNNVPFTLLRGWGSCNKRQINKRKTNGSY